MAQQRVRTFRQHVHAHEALTGGHQHHHWITRARRARNAEATGNHFDTARNPATRSSPRGKMEALPSR